jgi:hypothetical protein
MHKLGRRAMEKLKFILTILVGLLALAIPNPEGDTLQECLDRHAIGNTR